MTAPVFPSPRPLRAPRHPGLSLPLERPLGPPEIHEKAFCESADLSPGVVVEAGAYVGAGAVLGAGCRVRPCACVDGILGEDVWVGRGALVAAGVRVGEGATILAGSVVLFHVAAGQVVDGDPARPVA